MPATIEFVKKRLLPQDYVAVIAYNRATDFTTNHQQVLEVLERLKARQAKIEGLLEFHFDPRDLSTAYGSRQIPPHIQREIDAVFDDAAGLRSRTVTAGPGVPRMRDDLFRVGGARLASDVWATTGIDMALSDYIGDDLITMQDLDNVYGAINYLRYVEGEKHLVFVTPRGLLLPRAEDERSLAHVAADARVAMSLIYTGGVVGAPRAGFAGPMSNRSMVMEPVPSASAVFAQTFMVQAARMMAQETGGLASAFRYADYSFDRIDRATRFQYLLGYAPSNPDMDGRFRRVVVKVSRPGATVLYRRGYFATDQIVPVDRKAFVSEGRILAAGGFDKPIREIDITTKPPSVYGPKNAREVVVEGRIQSSQIAFTEVDGRRTASIDVAVFCGDRREHVIGEMRRVIELKLRDDTYAEYLKNGVEFSVRVPVSAEPRYVKVIAYDYAADVLGSAMIKLQ
jgi:VWFA-related protein